MIEKVIGKHYELLGRAKKVASFLIMYYGVMNIIQYFNDMNMSY